MQFQNAVSVKGQAVKPKAPVPLEKDIQAAIIEYAWYTFRLKLYRRNTGAMSGTYNGKKRFVRFSEPGQADLWGIEPNTGRHIECEIKRPGQKLTEAQNDWLVECQLRGAIAFMADSIESFEVNYRTLLGFFARRTAEVQPLITYH
jgi:hypothetical protein